MKTAVIIHGYNTKAEYEDVSRPAASNDHWLSWLQRQLLLKGIAAQTPEMPGFYEPHYDAWKKMLERFTPDDETILVGHSCGGGFLVRWLSETQTKVGKVVLVAPWLNPSREYDDFDQSFFDFEIDPQLVSKTSGLTILYSKDDFPSIITTVEILKSKLSGAEFKEFHDKGHFTFNDLRSEKFSELLEAILQ